MSEMAQIWTVLEPYLAAERLELDDVEIQGGGGGGVSLRVVVDGEDVNVDRLAELSRGISRLLDKEPGLAALHRLEVSSPGLERKLRLPRHFHKSVGREVVVKTGGGDGARTIRGVITEAGEGSFEIEGEQGTTVVEYDEVVSAKTVFRWEKAPKPGH